MAVLMNWIFMLSLPFLILETNAQNETANYTVPYPSKKSIYKVSDGIYQPTDSVVIYLDGSRQKAFGCPFTGNPAPTFTFQKTTEEDERKWSKAVLEDVDGESAKHVIFDNETGWTALVKMRYEDRAVYVCVVNNSEGVAKLFTLVRVHWAYNFIYPAALIVAMALLVMLCVLVGEIWRKRQEKQGLISEEPVSD